MKKPDPTGTTTGRFPKWLVAALGVAAVLLATVFYDAVGSSAGRSVPLTGATLLASTSTSCSSSTFCVYSSAPGPTVYPGGATRALPIFFTNPYNVPITIQTLQIVFTNAFPQSGCPATDFQVNDTAMSGTPPSVTIRPGVTVAANTGSSAPFAYAGAALGLLDDGNQNSCENLALTIAYRATATYNYVNCLATSQNGAVVPSGQVFCIKTGGKVTNGITVKSGGILLVNGGSVTGGIKASGAAGINFCGATISGGVKVSGSTGEVVIGDGQSTCPMNSISNGLSLTNNTAGIQVIGNNITGGFTATGNSGTIAAGTIDSPITPGQYVESNSGNGGMSCSGNNPPLSDGGLATENTITGARSGECAGTF